MPSSPRSPIFRQAALDRLSSPEQLDERLTLVSPRSWLALAGLGALLAGLLAWSVFGRIAITVEGRGRIATEADARGLRVSVCLPARDAREVRVGSAADVLPASYDQAEDGFIHGIVASIAAGTPGAAALDAILGDPSLAQRWTADGAVELVVTAAGPAIPAGMPCRVRLRIAEERPIALVLPVFGRRHRR
jgi:hypothetical protein